MTTSDHPQRMRQLRNLVVMALADGQLSEREVNLIADRCTELGLSESDLLEVMRQGLDDDAAIELPTDEDERRELLVDLVRMMGADGRLDESEKRLFALVAVKMRISSDELDRLIESSLK